MEPNNKNTIGQSQGQRQTQTQTQQQEATKKAEERAFSGTGEFHFAFAEKPDMEVRPSTSKPLPQDVIDAMCQTRSKEYMQILQIQKLSGMTDEQIKQIIVGEIIRGGAQSIEEVARLEHYLDETDAGADAESVADEMADVPEAQEMIGSISEEEVTAFLEMLSREVEERLTNQELQMQRGLDDPEVIKQSYHVTLCPICPEHDIHILPKDGHLYFCHLSHLTLTPVFQEAKRMLESGRAEIVHVLNNTAFIINDKGEVVEYIDVSKEAPLHLIIKDGWEELP